MVEYQLFAARDGDVIEEIITARDDDEARVIAAHRMVEEFRLELESRDFDEVVAETDGALLDLRQGSGIADCADEWARAQLHFVAYLLREIGNPLKPQVQACQRAILDLIQALDRNALNSKT